MWKPRIARPALALAALMALAPLPAAAQQVDPNRVIDLHLNVESKNVSFNGSVVEGGGFRVTLTGVGTFEIIPVRIGVGRYSVTVRGGPEGAESADLRQMETLVAREGVAIPIRSMPQVGLVIEGSRAAQASAAVQPAVFTFASLPRAAQDGCCVTCGGVIACACAVQASCGSCCVNPCCRKQVTLQDRFFPPSVQFASGTCGNPIRDEERLFTPAVQGARIATRG